MNSRDQMNDAARAQIVVYALPKGKFGILYIGENCDDLIVEALIFKREDENPSFEYGTAVQHGCFNYVRVNNARDEKHAIEKGDLMFEPMDVVAERFRSDLASRWDGNLATNYRGLIDDLVQQYADFNNS